MRNIYQNYKSHINIKYIVDHVLHYVLCKCGCTSVVVPDRALHNVCPVKQGFSILVYKQISKYILVQTSLI